MRQNMLIQFKNRVFSIFLIANLTSCALFEAKPTFCYIKNCTNKNIYVYLYFNKEKLKDIFGTTSYINYLENFDYGRSFTCVSETSLDTINLIGVYAISPNCFFDIYRKQSHYIEFIFNRIKIITKKDTIYFNDNDQLIRAFRKVDNNNFELQIK